MTDALIGSAYHMAGLGEKRFRLPRHYTLWKMIGKMKKMVIQQPIPKAVETQTMITLADLFRKHSNREKRKEQPRRKVVRRAI